MAIRDAESYRFSPNFIDFVTYNRFYATTGYNTTQIVQNGYLGDPYLTLSNGATVATLNRRVIPGGPFSTLGHSTRLLVGKTSSIQISAYDLVNSKQHCYVQFTGATGMITIGSSTSVLLTTNLVQFPINALFWVEILFTIGTGTSGAVSVKLPGTTINLTGVNTQNGARGLLDTTQYVSNLSGGTHFLMHGIWWDTSGSYNNTWIGDRRVYGSVVTANGDENDFTPVGNSQNWQNVANYPPNAADYNTSATIGNIELYKGTSPSGATSVAGVMASSIMMKTDAGTRSAANIIKSGASYGEGSTVPLPDSLNIQSDVFETDPATGVPFLPAALPLLQRGVKLIA